MVVEQVQEGQVFEFDLELGLEGPDVVERVRMEGRKKTFTLEAGEKVKGVVLDPEVRLLADFKQEK